MRSMIDQSENPIIDLFILIGQLNATFYPTDEISERTSRFCFSDRDFENSRNCHLPPKILHLFSCDVIREKKG